MASSLRKRANPFFSSIPILLKWRSSYVGLRGICSTSRLGVPSSSLSGSEVPLSVMGTNYFLDTTTFKEEFEIGSYSITLETGKVGPLARDAVIISTEETIKDYPYRRKKVGEVTKVLSTVAALPEAQCGGRDGVVSDFLPLLTVDYQGKQFAERMFFGTSFMRREGARIIDRPIRPLFPAGFYNEVQVISRVLCSDEEQDPDVMAANATSAALMLSDIPWGGPIGVVRIGRVDGKLIINPGLNELSLSDLDLVYACTRDKTLMMDVQAREVSERDLEVAVRLAHCEAVKYLDPQISLAAKAGKHTKDYKLAMVTKRTHEKVKSLMEAPIEAVFTNSKYGQFDCREALDKITQDVRRVLEEECDEESLKVLPKTVDIVRKKVFRNRIIQNGLRVDGRRLDEIRPLWCESGNLPMFQGSSLFSRGDTQVICTVTQKTPGDDAKCVDLFHVHGTPVYEHSNPPFSINEVGKGGLNRCEAGQGTLAEKALIVMLLGESNMPYTVHVNSEVKDSDGSIAMTTVCGGSIALMDAGIPLKKHVAGVSIGLVSDTDPFTGMIKDYRIMTDILDLEDHLGDMDLKVAGTRKGVTAIQLDIKLDGIPLNIICECLGPALEGRLQILDHMEREISAPRFCIQDEWNWLVPVVGKCRLTTDAVQQLIGNQGAQKREIEQETGARISVGDDGVLTIVGKNLTSISEAREKLHFNFGCVDGTKVGRLYKGLVSAIKEYGALVEFNGGQQGLLPVSELSHEQVSRVSSVVSVGQHVRVKCIDILGITILSLRAVAA